MNYKPEVEVDGKFYPNAVVFATKEEAEASAKDLFNRWLLTTDHRAVESDEPVNYAIDIKTRVMSEVVRTDGYDSSL